METDELVIAGCRVEGREFGGYVFFNTLPHPVRTAELGELPPAPPPVVDLFTADEEERVVREEGDVVFVLRKFFVKEETLAFLRGAPERALFVVSAVMLSADVREDSQRELCGKMVGLSLLSSRTGAPQNRTYTVARLNLPSCLLER